MFLLPFLVKMNICTYIVNKTLHVLQLTVKFDFRKFFLVKKNGQRVQLDVTNLNKRDRSHDMSHDRVGVPAWWCLA